MPSQDGSVAEGDLIACPRCDALQSAPAGAPKRLRCVRCGTVLSQPRGLAVAHVLMLSGTVLILMAAAVTLPFLTIGRLGLSSSSSILDAALAFVGGANAILAFAVLALIVLVPAIRAALLIYALAPLSWGGAPWPGARRAFAWDEDLRPWAMAEIFMIGVVVALVKIVDMARVDIGAAFWLLGALVAVSVLQDNALDRWTLWRALGREA